jgi:hypothetical protein
MCTRYARLALGAHRDASGTLDMHAGFLGHHRTPQAPSMCTQDASGTLNAYVGCLALNAHGDASGTLDTHTGSLGHPSTCT